MIKAITIEDDKASLIDMIKNELFLMNEESSAEKKNSSGDRVSGVEASNLIKSVGNIENVSSAKGQRGGLRKNGRPAGNIK